MSLQIDYDNLLATFDDLVASGSIFHTPSKVVRLVDKGYHFEFRVTQALSTKPQAEEDFKVASETCEDAIAERPVCFGAGSDIANGHPALLLGTVNDTHLVVINKFCVYRPQLLLLTVDSYRRQHEPLGRSDLEAAWSVLSTMKTPHYAMYNCTWAAGASRQHKHMHVIPRPEHVCGENSGFGFFPDNSSFDSQNVPFKHFIKHLSENSAAGYALLDVYLGLLEQTREALGTLAEDSESVCPHNVVMTQEWIMLIPRRSNYFHGATANAAGMMGSVWLMDEWQLDNWIALGPATVLSELGVSARAGDVCSPPLNGEKDEGMEKGGIRCRTTSAKLS